MTYSRLAQLNIESLPVETKEAIPTAGNGQLKHGRHMIAFGWYGGKYSHLDWLLPLLPDANH